MRQVVAPSNRLYDQVASRVIGMIKKGVLKAGMRIPSIRRMSDQMSVSISTVQHAYQILEDQGFIEARPKSGYFVRPRHLQRAAGSRAPMEPEMLQLPLDPCKARVQDPAEQISPASRSKEFDALGIAIPSPEFLPTEAINKHLARVVRYNPELASRYEFAPGLKQLRGCIAQRAMDSGCSFGPGEVVITNGTTEALALALRAVTEPGDTVAVESPCYFGFLSIANMLSLKVVEVSTDPRNGISVHDLEKVLEQKNFKIKALLLNPNVHNPLGSIMPDEKKHHIAELMRKTGTPVIEDDTYGELAFETPRPRCIKAFDSSGEVILCSSFSKTIAPGFRIGWISAGRWYERINSLKRVHSLGTATPPQMAVASYLETGGFDANLRRLRKIYREQLMLLSDVIRRNFPNGTRATNPQGGHLLWVELPAAVDPDALQAQLSANEIHLTHGEMFSASGLYRNCLRLNAAVPWNRRIEKAIALIGQLAGKACK